MNIIPFLMGSYTTPTCVPLAVPNLNILGVYAFKRYYCWDQVAFRFKRVSDAEIRYGYFANDDVELSNNTIMSTSLTGIIDGIPFGTWGAGTNIELEYIFLQTINTGFPSQNYFLSTNQTNFTNALIAENGVITRDVDGEVAAKMNDTILSTNGGIFTQLDDDQTSTLVLEASSTVSNERSVVFSNNQAGTNRFDIKFDRSSLLRNATVSATGGNSLAGLQSQKNNSNRRVLIVVKSPGTIKAWCDNDAPTSNTWTGTHTNDGFSIGAQNSPSNATKNSLTGFFNRAMIISGDAEASPTGITEIKSHFNV